MIDRKAPTVEAPTDKIDPTLLDLGHDAAKEHTYATYDEDALELTQEHAVTKLPTKQELMQNTAIMLKKMPQKLASALNQAGAQRIAKVTKQAAGQKLVNAVKAVETSGKLS